MKQTARAITLNCTKYSDNKLIVNTYTRELGRAAFAIRIPQNRKASPLSYCQPLFINEIEYNSAPEAEIKQASKIYPWYTYTSIPFSTTKTTTAIFITEILAKVLTFSEKNEELYDYIPCDLIPLSGSDRCFILEKIIEYYHYRFENIASVNSLEVLKTVFH